HYKGQIKRYDYEKIIKKWLSVFDSSQVLILSMEDIGQKPYELIEKVYAFLGRAVNLNHDLNEKSNATDSKPIPSTHIKFLEKNIRDVINYWEGNKVLFRL